MLGGYGRSCFVQVGHGVYLLWALFESEAPVQVRSFPDVLPTTDACDVGRVPFQVFLERDGHRCGPVPVRVEETVVEYETDHPTPIGHRADDLIVQMPVRRGQRPGVRVRRADAGKSQVHALPYALFGKVRYVPDETLPPLAPFGPSRLGHIQGQVTPEKRHVLRQIQMRIYEG